MMAPSHEDVETVAAYLGLTDATAEHYLACFKGDASRTIQAVLENGDDPSWWAHPHNKLRNISIDDYPSRNQGCLLGEGEVTKEEEGDSEEEQENEGDLQSSTENSDCEYLPAVERPSWLDENLNTRAFRAEEGPGEPNTVIWHDDYSFYQAHRTIVESFIDSVCTETTTKAEMRKLIAEADNTIFLKRTSSAGEQESGLVNRLSYKHSVEGRSPLSYAVAKNLYQQVYDLIDLGANVSKIMPPEASNDDGGEDEIEHVPKTALVLAATNAKRDGTEMVRILLSKGAKPSELENASVDESLLSRGMQYWIDKARRIGVPPLEELRHMAHLPPMDRIHELDYGVVGEEAAVAVVQEALAARFGNPQGSRGKPLVMIFLGPPGHGKTYFASRVARSLVGDDNMLYVACQSIRDDADLFGSRLGGSRSGEYSSDGQLTGWLRARQRKKCILFLDEFEKMTDLTSALGWGQGKKIYQSFLETWQDGTLSDQGAMSGGRSVASNSAGGQKIDCKESIWILTSNWGQREIIDFCEKHKEKMNSKIEQKDVPWIQKELVKKILRPLCMREFGAVHEDIKALCRRIDYIVPFLPFTKKERKVVADIAVSDRFSLYREPCVLTGPEGKRRSFGNLFMHCTRAFAAYAGSCYDPMQGASGMLSAVQQADGKFQMMLLRDQLGLTEEQKARVKSNSAPEEGHGDEPSFWVHFDKESEQITITQGRPMETDDDSSDDSSVEDPQKSVTLCGKETATENTHENDSKPPARRSSSSAADDAF